MGTDVKPGDIARAHEGSRYEVILEGVAHRVASARLAASGADWPTISATMQDAASLPALSGAMLGPSKEFAEIEVHATGKDSLKMHAHLTGYAQKSGTVELTLKIVRAERL